MPLPAPARILIVDDDPWIQKMVATILGKRGHTVEAASDGEEALRRAGATRPDLIITDVMMPRMDGWSFVRAVRSRPEFALTPVIFLTALSGDNDRIRGFRLGADDYLPKPFRFEELEARVATALAKRREMAADVGGRVSDDGSSNELVLPIDSDLTPPPELKRPAETPAAGRAPTAAPAAKPERRGRDEERDARRHVLHGALDHIGLSSLLVVLEMERKSGQLMLQRQGEIGRIWLRKGHVIRAALEAPPGGDARTGAEAVYDMLSWADGRFDFSRMDVEGEDEIRTSTTFLLMEGARLIDEMNRGSKGDEN